MNLKKCLVSYKMGKSKPVVFNDDHYFGHCRVLEHDNYYLNVHRAHWMVCDKCRIKWLIGENLFSFWRRQNEIIWNANAQRLKKYREINPLSLPNFTLKKGQCTEADKKCVSILARKN